MALIMLVAFEPMPLYPHINDYPITSASLVLTIMLLQQHCKMLSCKPSPFHSPAPIAFSIGMWKEGLET